MLPLLSGCADSAATQLPDGVSVSVHQGRLDGQARRLQIRISNSADIPLAIDRLSFSSAAFTTAAEYPKVPVVIAPREATNMPVLLGESVCDATKTTPFVTVDFSTSAVHGHTTVIPEDALNQLAGVTDRDCLDASISKIAVISGPTDLRIQTVKGNPVALIDLQVEPTGASASFTLVSARDTPLLRLIDVNDPQPVSLLPLAIEVSGEDSPSTVTIAVVPSRCDAHALADDKRGTILPIDVEAGRRSGVSYFPVSEKIKADLYEYIRETCAAR